MTREKRVFILGIDGGEFRVIDHLRSAGELPFIGRMMEEGVRRPLLTVTPPLTPAAWASFYTGTNPGRHGVIDFLTRRKDRYSLIPVHRSMVSGRPLWEAAGRADRRSLVINVPLTYPPDELKGWMISGMDTPGPHNRYFQPPGLRDEVLELTPDYRPDVHISRRRLKRTEGLREWYVGEVLKLQGARLSVVDKLSSSRPWDLAVAVLVASDRLQHVFWKDVEAAMSSGDIPGRETPAGAVFESYRTADAFLEKLWSGMDGEDHLMVISDHGFGPLDKEVNLNLLLAELGYLSFKQAPVASSLGRQLSGKAREFLPSGLRNALRRILPPPEAKPLEGLGILEETVDWDRTRAYAVGYLGGIYLNLRGREPGGIVPPEERAETLEALTASLEGFRDPEDGLPLVTEVHRREDIYRGPETGRLPDLVLTLRDHRCTARHSLAGAGEELFSKPLEGFGTLSHTGSHRPRGIFLGMGPRFAGKEIPVEPGIMDLFPTTLDLLGLPVPAGLDGSSLTGGEPVPETAGDAGDDACRPEPRSSLSSDEEQEVLENLKDLGYL
jgi:predicted AlkP superfamily phosphohydrolase/phosphomutase